MTIGASYSGFYGKLLTETLCASEVIDGRLGRTIAENNIKFRYKSKGCARRTGIAAPAQLNSVGSSEPDTRRHSFRKPIKQFAGVLIVVGHTLAFEGQREQQHVQCDDEPVGALWPAVGTSPCLSRSSTRRGNGRFFSGSIELRMKEEKG